MEAGITTADIQNRIVEAANMKSERRAPKTSAAMGHVTRR
jgi:hypothetical protein